MSARIMWRIPIWSRRLVCLVASGGHSHIVRVEDYGVYTLLGQTMDDAAGEAFDKAARVLGLPVSGRAAAGQAQPRGQPARAETPHVQTPGRYDYSCFPA